VEQMLLAIFGAPFAADFIGVGGPSAPPLSHPCNCRSFPFLFLKRFPQILEAWLTKLQDYKRLGRSIIPKGIVYSLNDALAVSGTTRITQTKISHLAQPTL
jgi:hypothetical protein